MKAAKTIVSTLLTLLLFFILFDFCICFVVFNPGYLMNKYRGYDTAGQLSMTEADLAEVTERLTDYVSGKADSLKIEVSVRGEYTYFFNETDYSHMKDVREIIITLRDLFVLSIFAAILFAFFLISKRSSAEFRKGVLIADGIVLIVSALVVIVANTNLDWLIVFCHNIIFDNLDWLLDPAVDNLIFLCPEQLFIDAGKTCGLIWGPFILMITVLGIFLPNIKFGKKISNLFSKIA